MNSYDIFCSYAHGDNDDGWVDSFVESLTRIYRKLSGVTPNIFIDHESLLTADMWEKKIRSALDSSRLLVAVVSPSYIKSEWCHREWELFSLREREMRDQRLLAEEQGLIFPILLFPLDRGRFSQLEETFVAKIKQRQWMDVSSQLVGTPIRPDQVRQLSEQVIDAIAGLARASRRPMATESVAPETIIFDALTGLEWAGELSSTEMSYKAARMYVSKMASGGWRLPTKSELESIIDPSALVDDPKASPYPLREPFNAQRFGYLHSGTRIGGGANYIMNVRNGYIFNGYGCDCYVRLVRKPSN